MTVFESEEKVVDKVMLTVYPVPNTLISVNGTITYYGKRSFVWSSSGIIQKMSFWPGRLRKRLLKLDF